MLDQILLSADELGLGLDDCGRRTPDVPVLVVASDVEKFAHRRRLELQTTFDDLGEVKLALVAAGELQFTVEWHTGNPVPGTTLCLLEIDVAPSTVAQLLDLLEIDKSEVSWMIPAAGTERRSDV